MMDLQNPCSKGCQMNATGDPQNDCGNCYMNDGAESAKAGTFQESTSKESLTVAADASGKPVTVDSPEFHSLVMACHEAEVRFSAAAGTANQYLVFKEASKARRALIAHIDAHTAAVAAKAVAAERTAKQHAIQQAQQWTMEARTQRGTVLDILRHFDCPEEDWRALELIKAAAPQQHAQAALSDALWPLIDAYADAREEYQRSTSRHLAKQQRQNMEDAKAELSHALSASQQPAAAPVAPAAWMTEDGERVVSAKTMDGAKRDGGAMLSSMKPFSVPLIRAAAPATQPQEARDWLIRNMPAGTVIGDPAWWADRIAVRFAAPAAQVAAVPGKEIPTELLKALNKHCCENVAWIRHAWAEYIAAAPSPAQPVHGADIVPVGAYLVEHADLNKGQRWLQCECCAKKPAYPLARAGERCKFCALAAKSAEGK